MFLYFLIGVCVSSFIFSISKKPNDKILSGSTIHNLIRGEYHTFMSNWYKKQMTNNKLKKYL